MTPFVYLLTPVALLLVYGAGVLFWAAVSQIRFLSYYRGVGNRPPRLGFRGWIRFHLRTLRGAYLLLWWALRAALRTGLRRPDGEIRRRPVLCVHGLFLNSTCMWGIRRRLELSGRPTQAVFMGVPLPSPLAYAGPLSRALRSLVQQFPETGFDLVAHSIGGVMIREVLSREPELAAKVRRIVTLGSPHHGTAALRWIRFGPIYRMLALNSDYVENLADFRRVAPDSSVITIATRHDLVVYPADTCHLQGTRRVDLVGVSHLGLMTESSVLDEVVSALEEIDDRVG